jgi:hypothetical protein
MTVREITEHRAAGLNEQLEVLAVGEPGKGGANDEYEIWIRDKEEPGEGLLIEMVFQRGPINEEGLNGISNEALLAIVADRLRGFQKGPCACGPNEHALGLIEEALATLHERIERGVEGTNQP